MRIKIYMFLWVFLLGCTHQEKVQDVPEVKCDFFAGEIKDWVELPDTIMSERKYILLDTLNKNCDFGHVSKIEIRNDRVYILDKRLKRLVVYEATGKGIGNVGTRGQGPKEYLDISDFTIARDGMIYFIDGRLDKLHIYNENLVFLQAISLPFEADVLQCVEGGFLFGLSSWNKGKGKGKKVVLTDYDLNIYHAYLNYDHYVDASFWVSDYGFIETDEHIVYNQPIDNHVYLFSKRGELQSCVNVDFGKGNVPNKYKINIERNLRNFDNYCLLKNYVVVTNRYIAGTLWDSRRTKPFIYDRKTDTSYQGKVTDDFDTSGFTGYCDSLWISYIEPDMDVAGELPDSIRTYLQAGGFVVCTQKLK